MGIFKSLFKNDKNDSMDTPTTPKTYTEKELMRVCSVWAWIFF